MGQQTTITLTDAAGTPVARAFNPAQKDGPSGSYRWDYRGTGVVVGYDQLTITTRLPSKQNKNTKVQMRLVCPTLEQTSPSTATGIQPAPTVAYNTVVDLTFVLPERSVLQDRKNALAMARDLIDEALTTAAVENYDGPFF
jgi:hypothetical protein